MQTAVPSGTAVFRGKWKRTDSGFAAFGGRGELRSPFSAPKCPFGTFRCSAWLIFRFRTDPPSVRRCSARLIRQAETLELQPRSRPPSSHTMAFAPKRSTSRFAPLTLRCRTEMFFQNIPVFRSAYSASETLELQPLRGLRWAGGASLPPAPPSPAALRIRGGQLQRLPLRGAGAQRLKGGCAMAMRSSAG